MFKFKFVIENLIILSPNVKLFNSILKNTFKILRLKPFDLFVLCAQH